MRVLLLAGEILLAQEDLLDPDLDLRLLDCLGGGDLLFDLLLLERVLLLLLLLLLRESRSFRRRRMGELVALSGFFFLCTFSL